MIVLHASTEIIGETHLTLDQQKHYRAHLGAKACFSELHLFKGSCRKGTTGYTWQYENGELYMTQHLRVL
jgi:hypothetical protein